MEPSEGQSGGGDSPRPSGWRDTEVGPESEEGDYGDCGSEEFIRRVSGDFT